MERFHILSDLIGVNVAILLEQLAILLEQLAIFTTSEVHFVN